MFIRLQALGRANLPNGGGFTPLVKGLPMWVEPYPHKSNGLTPKVRASTPVGRCLPQRVMLLSPGVCLYPRLVEENYHVVEGNYQKFFARNI